MAVWLVRAGKHGENEQFALDRGFAVIGWNELGDVSHVQSREQLQELIQKAYPEKSRQGLALSTGQMWSFLREMQKGDLIILPLKTRPFVAVDGLDSPLRRLLGGETGPLVASIAGAVVGLSQIPLGLHHPIRGAIRHVIHLTGCPGQKEAGRIAWRR